MLSVEALGAYPFFARLTPEQLESLIPMVMEESIPYGGIFFQEGQSAQYLFLVTRGSVDLHFKMPNDPRHRVLAGEINAVEPFGISALIEPHTYAMTARAGTDCHILRIEGQRLRDLLERDSRMGYLLMQGIAFAAMERLHLAQRRLAEAQEPELVI